MPKYWMVSDRLVDRAVHTFGDVRNPSGKTYWLSDGGNLADPASWTETDLQTFSNSILQAVAAFPAIVDVAHHEEQKHVALFVHGYNNTWAAEAARYQSICDTLFAGDNSMGLCIWFDWPSKGTALGYLPDRGLAEQCAPDLADVLQAFYESLVKMEKSAAATGPNDPNAVCRAKVSVIAHSMGNYVLQRAMFLLWRRINQPLLVSLITQALMVAADVDNDLFKSGESVQNTDGDGIANLAYRVTALYSGLDAVLGASAGLKHFGKRRLGRSGLDKTCPCPDNVWDIDCTPLLPDGAQYREVWNVHGIYFDPQHPAFFDLMRQVLKGLDRGILVARNPSLTDGSP